MITLGNIIYFLIRFLCLIPAVYGVKHFSNLTPTLKAFTLLMCLSVVCEIPSNILFYLHMKNAIIFHVYAPIQIILMCYAFKGHLTSFIKPNTLMIVGLLCAILSVLNSFFIQPYYVINSYANGTITGITLLMILGYFLALVKSDQIQPFSTIPEVWIFLFLVIHLCTAFFVYIGGDLFSFLPRKTIKFIWALRNYSMLVFYLSIALGIWIHRKQQA